MRADASNQISALSRLALSQPIFGLMQTVPNPSLTELAVWSGYDFVILDCEHGIVDEPAHIACLQVISGSPAFAAVRLRPGDFGSVGRYLDFGADAILMADVQTPEEAARFAAAATFGPQGTRSSTKSTRALRWVSATAIFMLTVVLPSPGTALAIRTAFGGVPADASRSAVRSARKPSAACEFGRSTVTREP